MSDAARDEPRDDGADTGKLGGPTGEGDTPAPVAMSAELWSYEPAGGSKGA